MTQITQALRSGPRRADAAGCKSLDSSVENPTGEAKAIRRVLLGKVFVSENVMTEIAARLGRPKADLQPIARLSDRELQVFELIGKGMSSSDIAERMHVSIKTVQVYVARAKEKFNVPTLKELLREAFRWEDATNDRSGEREQNKSR